MSTSTRRISSGGYWYRPLEIYFEELLTIWEKVGEFYSRTMYLEYAQTNRIGGKHRSSESQRKLAEMLPVLHKSILKQSKEADNHYEAFRNRYNNDFNFCEQAPIRPSYKSIFSTTAIKDFNPTDESATEIFMESVKAGACLLFQRKQATFMKRLSQLVKLHNDWIKKFDNHEENVKSLEAIRKVFNHVEILGMDLNFLFFQADFYILTASEISQTCEGASIHDIEPSRFYLVNNKSRIFLFEEHQTLHNYCETFKDLPEEGHAEFDRFLQNYINKKEAEKPTTSQSAKLKLDDGSLELALQWVEEQAEMGI